MGVSSSRPEKRSTLLDLPREIRAKIWSHVDFTNEQPIRIDATWAQGSVRLARIGQKAKFNSRDMGREEYQKAASLQRTASLMVMANIGLVRTCKEFAREITRMVYSLNTFEFCNLKELSLFLRAISDNRTFLRHIRIVNYRPWTFGRGRYVFEKLTACTMLESLTINFAHIFRHGWDAKSVTEDIDQCVSDLKPLLLSLRPGHASQLVKVILCLPCGGCLMRRIKHRFPDSKNGDGVEERSHASELAAIPWSGEFVERQIAAIDELLWVNIRDMLIRVQSRKIEITILGTSERSPKVGME